MSAARDRRPPGSALGASRRSHRCAAARRVSSLVQGRSRSRLTRTSRPARGSATHCARKARSACGRVESRGAGRAGWQAAGCPRARRARRRGRARGASAPRPREPRGDERRGEVRAVGDECEQLVAHRARRDAREDRAQRVADAVLALRGREVAGVQLALDAEAHERHRGVDALLYRLRALAWMRSAPSAHCGSGTTRTARLPGPTRAARNIASWPALSASRASATFGARRASSPTCSSVSAVPVRPTVLRAGRPGASRSRRCSARRRSRCRLAPVFSVP